MIFLSLFCLVLIFNHYPYRAKKMNLHSGMKDPQKPYSRARLLVKAKKNVPALKSSGGQLLKRWNTGTLKH
jgi:hypothetical protein